MVLIRKGLGIGNGKGYYNLQYRDPYIHSLSARGVKSVNLKRYSGKWYNQASIPTWFDKGCKNQTAQYNLKDGKIQVINSCDIDGTIKKIEGSARSVSPDNSKLKVSFFPLVESDYIIEYLDKDYNFAIVGSTNKDYLWFLSRSKTIPKKKYDELIGIAKNKGYDVSKLNKYNLNAKQFKRSIMWNPRTKQFISGEESHSDLLRRKGKDNINEWVRGIYDKDSNTIYVRHYWNPKSHYAEFTAKDFENSEKQQKQFIKHLKPAKGVKVRYNSTNESLRQEGFIYV